MLLTYVDAMTQKEIESTLGDKVSMCNVSLCSVKLSFPVASSEFNVSQYWGNRLCTQAADRAIQIHGGIGYSRHKQYVFISRALSLTNSRLTFA